MRRKAFSSTFELVLVEGIKLSLVIVLQLVNPSFRATSIKANMNFFPNSRNFSPLLVASLLICLSATFVHGWNDDSEILKWNPNWLSAYKYSSLPLGLRGRGYLYKRVGFSLCFARNLVLIAFYGSVHCLSLYNFFSSTVRLRLDLDGLQAFSTLLLILRKEVTEESGKAQLQKS